MTDFRETLTDMSLGIVDNVPPDQIPDNAVADALNMTFDKRQQLRSRPGCSVFNPNLNLVGANHIDWSAATGTFTTAAGTAPDGTTTAVSITSGLGYTAVKAVPLVSGTLYTYKIWIGFLTSELDEASMDIAFWADGSPFDLTSLWYSSEYGQFKMTGYANLAKFGVSDPVVIEDYTWVEVHGTADLGITGTFDIGFDLQKVSKVPLAWGFSFSQGLYLPADSYVATDAVVADNYLTDRVTSLYQHRNTGGTSAVYATSGSQLFEFDSTNKFFDDITGALALPDDTLWQWITFNGEAIGVNRSNTAAAKANPVVIPTPGGTPAALTGSPPKGRYIASFNDRVWIVDEDEPWKVAYSKLGDHEDWTDTGISAGAGELEIGGGQENFDITGLHVHQGVLIVFKRRSIYAIVPGSPNTDIRQYSVVELTQEIGCLSGYTVKSIVNDVVFLSSDGLTTLSLISRGGNYEAAFLSQNLEDFQDFDRGAAENAVATVCPVKSQYIISFRSPNATFNDRTYVFDYSRFQDGNVGFTRCDGAWLAQSFANIVDDSGGDCVLMGGKPENGVALVWVKDGNGNTFTDGGRVYEQIVTTKAYAPQDLFIRKKFQRWGLYLQLLTTPFEISVVVKTDLKGTSTKTYKLTETGQVVQGSRWDEAVWDTDTWGDADFVDIVFTNRKFSPRSGSGFSPEGNLMQFSLSPKAGDGFVFRGLLITGDFLNDHQRGQA